MQNKFMDWLNKKVLLFASFILVLVMGIINLQTADDNLSTKNNFSQGSGVEVDSLKRLETVAQSGSKWGMSPFGSGKPLEEEEDDPLEWKTRTLSGITYVFGEGNPKEVAINNSKINNYWKNGGETYMNGIAEYAMRDLIQNTDSAFIFNQCVGVLDHGNYDRNLEWRRISFEIKMEDVLYVDAATGRKEFHMNKIAWISDMLAQLEGGDWQKCLSDNDHSSRFIPLGKQYLAIMLNYGSQPYSNE